MGQDTNQIEREIRDHRADLGRNLDELQDRARELADWRTHYRNHHAALIGAAFGVGALLGLMTIPQASGRPRPRRMAPHLDIEPDISHDPYRQSHSWREGQGTAARALRQLDGTWAQIADALIVMASDKAVELVGNVVPGLRDHLGRAGQDERRVH